MEEVIYKNYLNHQITKEEAIESKSYVQLVKLNGARSRAYYFKDGQLKSMDYFLSESKAIDNIRNEFAHIEIAMYDVMLKQNNYVQYLCKTWSADRILRSTTIRVFNGVDQIIYGCVLEPETEKSIFINKWAYNSKGETMYEFYYNPDGTFKYCWIFDKDVSNHDGEFYPEDIGDSSQVAFTWDGYEYYQTAEPKIPNDLTS